MMKKPDMKSILKFLLLVALGGIVLFCVIKYGTYIKNYASEPEKIRAFLRSFEQYGMLVYVLIQALHVLVVVIPGDIFNVCGGYIYGIPFGFVLSMTGIMLGTVIAFYISRFLGYDFISCFIPDKKISELSEVLNSNRGKLGLLIICLIPGIPKDLLIYVAGLTPIKASRLFIIYAISRIPGTLIWVSVGANVYKQDLNNVIIIMALLTGLVSICFLYKKKYRKVQPLAKNEH